MLKKSASYKVSILCLHATITWDIHLVLLVITKLLFAWCRDYIYRFKEKKSKCGLIKTRIVLITIAIKKLRKLISFHLSLRCKRFWPDSFKLGDLQRHICDCSLYGRQKRRFIDGRLIVVDF